MGTMPEELADLSQADIEGRLARWEVALLFAIKERYAARDFDDASIEDRLDAVNFYLDILGREPRNLDHYILHYEMWWME